jgi:hypothetical protein
MVASIRGHSGIFKVFENGEEHVFDTITNVSVNQDSSFSRSEYVGNPIPEGDQSLQGFSGSFDNEVKNDVADRFIDNLITNNLNGIGVSDYSFITTELYPDGKEASYVYFDCQFSLSKSQSGLSDKITKSISFQAAGRIRL